MGDMGGFIHLNFDTFILFKKKFIFTFHTIILYLLNTVLNFLETKIIKVYLILIKFRIDFLNQHSCLSNFYITN
jgi:hypothetical protein